MCHRERKRRSIQGEDFRVHDCTVPATDTATIVCVCVCVCVSTQVRTYSSTHTYVIAQLAIRRNLFFCVEHDPCLYTYRQTDRHTYQARLLQNSGGKTTGTRQSPECRPCSRRSGGTSCACMRVTQRKQRRQLHVMCAAIKTPHRTSRMSQFTRHSVRQFRHTETITCVQT